MKLKKLNTMIQPGERFDVQGKTLEAVTTPKEVGCEGCTFLQYDDSTGEHIGCMDPMAAHDCFDLDEGTYVIFKEIENELS
jgi:hypothetical protein